MAFEGKKYDEGKLRYDLIPPEALEALVKRYTSGAAKYNDRNWEKGILFSRVFGAMMRHAWAWYAGETIDKETGENHMAAVAWNAFALLTYQFRGMDELDDRPVSTPDKR